MTRTVGLLIATAIAVLGTSAGAALALSGAASSSPGATASAANVDAAVRAVRTAASTGGGRPYDIDRERFRGAAVWEVDVARAAGRSPELYVSADGRRVLRSGTTRRSADADRARGTRVGLAAALRTAAGRANGRLEEADVDLHRGRTVWSVTFERRGTETEVYVDASSGNVVRVEHDD